MDNWEHIYNLSPGYLFSLSDDGTVSRINAALSYALGYEWAEVTSHLKVEDLLSPGTKIFFQTHLLPLIKMQGSAKELYLIFRAKDGTRVPALFNVLVEGADDSAQLHFAGIEISNRNQFEKELYEAKNIAEKALFENKELVMLKEQLEQNQQMLEKQLQQTSRFYYEHQQISKVLSHDLQEPLRKIHMFISLIDLQIGTDSPLHTNFLKIQKFAGNVRALINSTQRFNALGNRNLNYEELDLEVILNLAKTRAKCPDAKIMLDFVDSFSLKADQELITSFFEELFSNSCKFSHNAKPLEISIKTDLVLNNIFKHTESRYRYETFVRIIYSDNGSGFDKQYSKQVFELFKKLHAGEGLGIGLAYCKKIIELHNGSITVASSEERGTTFTILLPYEPQLIITDRAASQIPV